MPSRSQPVQHHVVRRVLVREDPQDKMAKLRRVVTRVRGVLTAEMPMPVGPITTKRAQRRGQVGARSGEAPRLESREPPRTDNVELAPVEVRAAHASALEHLLDAASLPATAAPGPLEMPVAPSPASLEDATLSVADHLHGASAVPTKASTVASTKFRSIQEGPSAPACAGQGAPDVDLTVLADEVTGRVKSARQIEAVNKCDPPMDETVLCRQHAERGIVVAA